MTVTDHKRLPNTGAGHDFPVPIRKLAQGTRFVCYTEMAGVWNMPDRVEYGTVLWVGEGSVEIWWDNQKAPTRCTPELEVYVLEPEELVYEQIQASISFLSGEYNVMTTATSQGPTTPTPSTNPQISALIARYGFQLKQLIQALEGDDKAKASIALSRIEKALREAGQLHIALPVIPDALKDYTPLTDLLATEADKAKEHAAETELAKTRQQANTEKHTNRAVAMEKHNNEVKAAKAPREAKPKAEKKLRPCLDGCGEMVPGNFKMGHDAKLKSTLIKIERGELTLDAIPEPCLDLVKIVKGDAIQERDSAGNPKGEPKQTFQITAAPVRFPGRDDIALTKRED